MSLFVTTAFQKGMIVKPYPPQQYYIFEMLKVQDESILCPSYKVQ